MFTGLVAKVGQIVSMVQCDGGARLTIRHKPWKGDPVSIGESISVHGACLTVTSASDSEFTADVLDETLDKTNLADIGKLNHVNLERALKLGDRIGGHIVTGHVDGQGRLKAINMAGRDRILVIECTAEIIDNIVLKGSIAVNGISLTVSDVQPNTFSVNIIPFTWESTSLGNICVGDSINLETDVLGKYARKTSNTALNSEITLDKLKSAGFI